MRRTAGKGAASLIGAAAALFIASELYRDVFHGEDFFAAPRPLKVVALGIVLWLAMQEATKVHGRLEELLDG